MNSKPDNAHKAQDKLIDFHEPRTVQSQAAQWLARLDADTPADADIEAFRQWINESEAHRREFEKLTGFWDELNVLTQVVTPREISTKQTIAGHRKQRRKLLPHAFAGLVLVSVLAVTFILVQFPKVSPSQPLIYTTAVGEQENIKLPDGTSVLLNTNSRLEVHYSEQQRSVYLTQGEAHFDVFHQPQRPFEVFAGHGLVRALGTAFVVHLINNDIEVVVTEGVVEIGTVLTTRRMGGISKPSAPAGDGLQQQHAVYTKVTAGKRAVFKQDAVTQLQLVQVEKIEQKLSWREGMLMFEAESLEQVVKEMGRYTSMKILIPERELRELVVGGIFRIGDTESLFEALQDGFGIRVEYVSDNFVYLVSNAD